MLIISGSDLAEWKQLAMLYVIIGHDGPDGATLRPTVRPAHVENLRPLGEQGKLVIAGPFLDGSGSLIIVDMDSEAAALEFAHNDPYTTGGVFDRVEVKPFRKVFPE
ncbi:MAG TPA: YciI family protein [Candidatus Binataceae bacterium]